MNISETGIDLIKGFEGFSAKPYLDIAGVPTIAYGHTAGVTMRHPPITQAEGEKMLLQDLKWAEAAVDYYVTVPLTQNQFDALVSFVFNLGATAFRRSTLLKKINAGKHDEVPEQLQKWVNAGGKPSKGLMARRLKESALYQTKG